MKKTYKFEVKMVSGYYYVTVDDEVDEYYFEDDSGKKMNFPGAARNKLEDRGFEEDGDIKFEPDYDVAEPEVTLIGKVSDD